ncbi:STAS domain-containing protein [Desulfotruncus alcoholivorax]|uniref:STAS domain-containing protein n=1 Tax=Desulfotruncus alcoholivorax TaxID=265477 RepID=UPI00041C54A6|nr:STAS domain-containing protein [Desulfotruncus alcoholivorax]
MINLLTIRQRVVANGTVILDLAGDLNKQAEEEMLKAYQQASKQGFNRVLYNFSEVGNINSSGLAILIGIISEARKEGQNIVVFNLKPHYEKVFHMVGLPKYIKIFRDETQALGESK